MSLKMKKIILFSLFVFSFGGTFANDSSFPKDFFSAEMFPIYFILGMLGLIIILIGIVSIQIFRFINMLTENADRESALKMGTAYIPTQRWWTRLMQRLNDSVPIEDEKSIEMDHNYDGIKELDNHLPPWWKWLFYGSIAWSVVYIIVFHFIDTLPLQLEEYENEVAVAEQQAGIHKAAQPQTSIDENTLVYSLDAAIVEKGRKVFMDNNCGACHRNDGGGNTVGPNLTDAYWLYGGGITNIYTTIKNGVIEKGMPAWGKSMSPENVRDVSFFVMSLQGSNPENPKSPQGDIFSEPELEKSDTTEIRASR